MVAKSVALVVVSLSLASGFLAPTPTNRNAITPVKMAKGAPATFDPSGEPGGVQWFPSSAPYWDPLGFTKDKDEDGYWRLAHGEIKNGRLAMLACLDYFVRGAGLRFPFQFGKVSTEDIPLGLGAIKALPWAVWLQIGFFCLILEVLTENPGFGDRVPGRVPGNLQPDTESFAAPGDLEIRTKEINNARLAMISIWGLWVGEIVSGGANPFDSFAQWLNLK